MNRRRRDSRGAVMTLFSFQDVMTTVMGIMILVTLLLALDLAEQVGQAEATEPVTEVVQTGHPVADLEALEQRVAELEAAYEAAARRAARLVEAGGLGRADLERAIAQLLELQREALELERQVQQRRSEMAHSPEQQRLQQRYEQIIIARRQAEALREQIEQRRRNPRLTYLLQEQLDRRPVLLEVSGDRLGLGRPDDEESVIWLAQPRQEDRMAALEALMQLYNPRRDYFVILLKPSAGRDGYERVRQLVGRRGFNVGLELLDEDQTVLP